MTPDLSLRLEGLSGNVLKRAEALPLGLARPSALRRADLWPDLRIGVIRNARARLNVDRAGMDVGLGADCAMPRSHDELHDVLARFARDGVNALVIDGGDGTVRDVLTAAPRYFRGVFPRVAVVASGKTNALAADLGTPRGWSESAAIEALHSGRVEMRAPIEIWRAGAASAELRGFIIGAGAFVRATELAQQTHRLGAFNGLAVGLSVAGGVAQTLLGGATNVWRRGTRMRIAPANVIASEGYKYIIFGSTLMRMPLGMRPFGATQPGLKLLSIDAPPASLALALPALLGGGDLPGVGYRRDRSETIEVSIDGDFVLDGETFAGGDLILRQGAPIRFAVA